MWTPNTFKLIDEVEWIGQEVQKVHGCIEGGWYESIPAIIASIQRSLVRVEKMIEEKG